MSDAAAIQVNSISKAYGGSSALNGLTFSVPRGGEFGWFAQSGRIGNMPMGWVRMSDFVGVLKPNVLTPWGIHTWFATVAAWVAQMLFVGDGIHA